VPSRRVTAAAAAGAAAAAALALRALWTEPRRTVVRRRALRLPNWPPELDGTTLAVVGDLHAGAAHVDVARVERIAAAIAERRPDIIMMAGDLVDDEGVGGTRIPPEDVARALGRAGEPRIAVLGNHDRSFGEQRVAGALRAAGFDVLADEPVALEVRGHRVWVGGLEDATTEHPRPHRALDGVPEDEPLLVLTHNPDAFPLVPDRAALTVAGHTHGGQVGIPRLRARVIPSRYGERYAAGHIVEGGRHLVVTRGVGTSRWPVRLLATPEVLLLRLRPARPQRRRGAGR
jgi:predicted MPP superfamily phosphohydrolase